MKLPEEILNQIFFYTMNEVENIQQFTQIYRRFKKILTKRQFNKILKSCTFPKFDSEFIRRVLISDIRQDIYTIK